jgi:hypothetical protein
MSSPAPPPTARLVVAEADGVTVSLVGDSGSFAPGDVPAGRYALLAHFRNREAPTTTPLVLEADRTYTVRCESRMFRCVVE